MTTGPEYDGSRVRRIPMTRDSGYRGSSYTDSSYTDSRIIALARPPASHIVCRA